MRVARLSAVASLALMALASAWSPPAARSVVLAVALPAAQRVARDTQRVASGAADAARDAQHSFERERRRSLPWWNGPTPRRCDEVVGRFCLWHDEDSGFDPGPEREKVKAAREELLAILQRSSDLSPADGWVAGQRVRYLVEAARLEEARSAAAACAAEAAEAWWCSALMGYAMHALGAFPAADSHYAVALASMPAEERCQWRDLSDLLEGDLLDSYEDLSCEQREALEGRIWWLADPMYMVPGNDRRTEHFSRHVLNRLQPEAASPYGVAWGPDLEEILIRYGWPQSWSRRRHPVYSAGRRRPSITGHDPPRSFRFLPPADLVSEFATIAPADWELEPRRPHEEYLPKYASSFDDEEDGFENQLAIFRRGRSAFLIGAYEWTTDSLPPDTPLRVALVCSRETGGSRVAESETADRRGVLTLLAPPETCILAIEALAASAGRAARVRHGRRIAAFHDRPAISDILLLDPAPSGAAPGSLEEALDLARPSTRVRPGERVALLWELYGVREGTRLDVRVSLTKPGKSFLRRAAEWIGLVRDGDPTVSLEWREESAGGPGPVARFLELQIPDLSEGGYLLSASVRLATGAELTSGRIVRVEDG